MTPRGPHFKASQCQCFGQLEIKDKNKEDNWAYTFNSA